MPHFKIKLNNTREKAGTGIYTHTIFDNFYPIFLLAESLKFVFLSRQVFKCGFYAYKVSVPNLN